AVAPKRLAKQLLTGELGPLDRQIRACTPAPGAWTTYAGERLKLGPLTPADGNLPPGEMIAGKNAVVVGTGTVAVRLGEVQAVGKRPMAAADWARGLRLAGGESLA
ncbi:MAG: methionyl-tRNA formyltransferase, partial [Nocardioidaceae bacterium]|nr:methionyl-tRNA formyltransferase [Nocardioidaceae bacterium]